MLQDTGFHFHMRFAVIRIQIEAQYILIFTFSLSKILKIPLVLKS